MGFVLERSNQNLDRRLGMPTRQCLQISKPFGAAAWIAGFAGLERHFR